jgi:hypothetical protein
MNIICDDCLTSVYKVIADNINEKHFLFILYLLLHCSFEFYKFLNIKNYYGIEKK